MQPTTCQESSSSSELPPNDLDKPIAQKKGVRSYTRHPMSNFISYDSMSPTYKAFVLSCSSVSIPQDWRKAFEDPK